MAAKTGTKHHNAKLNVTKVRTARRWHAEGKATINELAVKYDVSTGTMWMAITGKTWKHVQ